MDDSSDYLKPSEWGPFRLPGEKRRNERSIRKARQFWDTIDEVMHRDKYLTDEQLYPELEDDD